MAPMTESHGGCSYCAVAALSMLGRLDDVPRRDQLLQWCTGRQISGFQGRIEKDPDSCILTQLELLVPMAFESAFSLLKIYNCFLHSHDIPNNLG